MQLRTLAMVTALFAAGALTACGSGSSGPAPNPIQSPTNSGQGTNPDPNGYIAGSIGAINAIGAPVEANGDQNEAAGGGGGGNAQVNSKTATLTVGQCTVEGATSLLFRAPDQNGDANSTELTRYQDTTCTKPWVDTVRVWSTPNGAGTEHVVRTISKWAPTDGATPSIVRNETADFSGVPSFNQYGYPTAIVAGTTRDAQSTVSVNGVVATTVSDEFVGGGQICSGSSCGSGNSSTATVTSEFAYCGDTTGYDSTGDPILNETFGWFSQTDATNGLRTNYSDGTVVFQSTRNGVAFTGPRNFMSIGVGTPNTTCPSGGITAPLYTAQTNGGTQRLPFNVPVSMTFLQGYLKSFSVTNAQLANGFVLNASSTGAITANNFITGTVATAGGQQIATFSINANGFGSLSIITGNTYKITDWHIVS